MGIRSDVGVALHKSIHDGVLEKNPFLNEAQVFKHEEGTLYVFTEYKWYTGIDEEVTGLYKTLEEIEDGSLFLIVEACSEYPDASDSDIGCWSDNPWGLQKCVSVSLEFEVEDK